MEGAYRVLVALDLPGESRSGISARGGCRNLARVGTCTCTQMEWPRAGEQLSPGQPQHCDLGDHKDSLSAKLVPHSRRLLEECAAQLRTRTGTTQAYRLEAISKVQPRYIPNRLPRGTHA